VLAYICSCYDKGLPPLLHVILYCNWFGVSYSGTFLFFFSVFSDVGQAAMGIGSPLGSNSKLPSSPSKDQNVIGGFCKNS